MQTVDIQINKLKPYAKNAKKHDQTQIDNVAESIKQFGMVQPIVIDKNNVVIIGHCRLEACKKLKFKEVPCVLADTLTDEQVAKLRLLDNKLNESDWDFDLLGEELADLDLSDFDLDWNIEHDKELKFAGGGVPLVESFIVPPLSVLDTKQGYWQDRKRMWKELGIKSELGRDDDLLGGLKQLAENAGTGIKGTSVFDPVLCEIMYKWFCPQRGVIYDCFAGGSVRGIVAEKLGYKYIGIDLRKEQVDANIINAKELNVSPTWHCDDSLNVDKYIDNESVDMIFSCPPYFDLEEYSKSDMSASENYKKFMDDLTTVFTYCYAYLKEGSFAVVKVGEIRDNKTGEMRGFVPDTINMMKDIGWKYYNEIILINQSGTAAIRSAGNMKSRKIVKCHQNIFVFYKGDTTTIKDNFEVLR